MPAAALWNPNSPALLGLEQASLAIDNFRVASLAQQELIRWTSQATGAVGDLACYGDTGSVAGAINAGPVPPTNPVGWFAYAGQKMPVLLDVVPRANEVASAVQVDTYPVTAVSGWNNAAGGASATTDVTTQGDGSYLKGSSTALLTLTFAGASAFANRHVLAVEFELWSSGSLIGARTIGATTSYAYDSFSAVSAAVAQKIIRYGEIGTLSINGPSGGGVPGWWTPAAVQAFGAGGTSRLALWANNAPATLDYAVMRVYSVLERRLAVAPLLPAGKGWAIGTAQVPTRTGAWSSVNGTDYTAVLRRPVPSINVASYASESTLVHRRLKGTPIFAGLRSRKVATIDLAGPSYQVATVAAADDAVTPTFRVKDTTPADRADSQPYVNTGVLAFPHPSAQDASFGVALPAGADYRQVYAVLSADLVPAGSNVKLYIGDSLGPKTPFFTLTKDDVDGSPVVGTARVLLPDGTVKTVTMHRARAAAASSSAGETGAYVIVGFYPTQTGGIGVAGGSGATTSAPWVMAYLVDEGASTFTAGGANGFIQQGYDATPGGTYTTAAGFGDANLTVALPINAPATITPTAGLLSGLVPRVSVAWTNPAGFSSSGFTRWEVERWTAADGWQRIAEIPTAATLTFLDLEVRVGVATQYRVRQVRAGDVQSDWITSGNVTATGTEACLLYFTSNLVPATGLAYPDVDGSRVVRGFDFIDAGEVTFAEVYGRDYQVSFRTLEKRGVKFQRRILVAGGGQTAPASVGPANADPLRALAASSAAPYVCVRDGQGNRWLGAVVVSDLASPIVAPWNHESAVTVTETTATPAVATA